MENESPVKQEEVKEATKVTFIAFPVHIKLLLKAKAKSQKQTQQEYIINLVRKDLGVM